MSEGKNFLGTTKLKLLKSLRTTALAGTHIRKSCVLRKGGKPKPKPENPVLKEIFETQTESDTCSAKFFKT